MQELPIQKSSKGALISQSGGEIADCLSTRFEGFEAVHEKIDKKPSFKRIVIAGLPKLPSPYEKPLHDPTAHRYVIQSNRVAPVLNSRVNGSKYRHRNK